MRKIGIITLVIGILGLMATLGVDTTVETRGSERVHNIGLMNAQQNILLVFIAVAVAGVVILVSNRKTQSLPSSINQQAIDKDQSDRACPFCAELIKPQAILCRYCNRDVAPLAPRECGSQVSESVVQYPKCESESSASGSGQLTIHRASKLVGCAIKLKVVVDGQAQGTLKNGEKMTVALSSGQHKLEILGLSWGGPKGSTMVNVHGGVCTVYSVWPELSLSSWGGIRFELA